MRFYFTEQISKNKYKSPEGYLICKDCVIARTGIQIYTPDEIPYEPDGNGLIYVERTPEEVFKPESIASFAGKPFVIHHPTQDGEVIDVTPENWRDLACGTINSPRRGTGIYDDVLVADLIITDKDAIEIVMNNSNNELSCGYDAEYVPLGPGKVKQVDIVGNHVAWVESGRCGPKCRISDSAKNVLKEMNMPTAKKYTWLDSLLGKAKDAKSFEELAALRDEAIKSVEEETKPSTSDGEHTHIHLHPHSSGDNLMEITQPVKDKKVMDKPVMKKPVMSDSDRISQLEQGHQKIQETLQMICQALGIGENGEELEDEGEGEGGFDDTEAGEMAQENNSFNDEANLERSTPHYNAKENAGLYESGDYREGMSLEGEKQMPLKKNTPTRFFGAEAPPGSSGALYTGDKAKRRTGDSNARLRAEWQNMVADAEVIIPGVRVPTVDSKAHPVNIINTMCSFRRRVLDRVSQDINRGVDLDNITAGRPIRRMTCDSVSTVFRSLATLYRDRNNTGVMQMGTGRIMGGASPATAMKSIADFQKKINAMSESTWGTGGATR